MNYKVMFSKFNFRRTIFLNIIILWIICTFLSFIGHYLEYKEIPNIIEALLINNITALLSLPKSFGDLLHITKLNSTDGTVILFVLYWPILVINLIFMIKTKLKILFFTYAIILILSSFYWMVVSYAMMGI